jgi:hypothetical protein
MIVKAAFGERIRELRPSAIAGGLAGIRDLLDLLWSDGALRLSRP